VVLDTDVASASFLGRLPEAVNAKLARAISCITFVTLGELTKWTAVRSWGPHRIAKLARWSHRSVVLPYDEAVATTWGLLQAAAQRRGRPRPPNDTWIAACCLVEGVPLATFNTKHFVDFVEHDGLRLVELS
jgi:predicted nucleic acid-binding protein